MPPFWRVAMGTILGVGLKAFARRYYDLLLPRRLFLYSYKSERSHERDPNGLSVAAVATISRNHFQIERTFPFGDWSTVASAANGSKKWLFLHNRTDGSAATGLVDRNYEFRPAKYYPPGSLSNWPYQYTIVNGRGHLLLIGSGGKDGTIVGFAQVLDDGTFVEWWRTVLKIPGPNYGSRWNASIVGLPNGHAWVHNNFPQPGSSTPAKGSTVYVFDVKHALILSSRSSDQDWHGIVADGNTLYLYNSFEKKAEVCVVNNSQQLVTMKPTQYDIDLFRNRYEYVASTPGAHLCYEYGTGSASVRVLSLGGFPATVQVGQLYGFWDYAVRC